MSISGTWQNAYGSTMELSQSDDGFVIGLYSSSTGSSGTYWVVGHANPTPDANAGQAVALSIYWRSIAGGPSNPTWHYVSGFSGQLVTLDGTPSMVLLHAMVDSDDSPGPGGLGTYLDKLVYTQAPQSQTLKNVERLREADDAQDPVCGTWATTSGPALSIDVLGVSDATGYTLGTITPAGSAALAAVGFTDVTAGPDGLALQSLSLAAFDAANATVWSLAGTLNLKTGVLTVLQMQSHGTAPDNTYAQTTVTQFVLSRVG